MELRDKQLEDVIFLICAAVTTTIDGIDRKNFLLYTVLKQYDPKPPEREELMDGKIVGKLKGQNARGVNIFHYLDKTTNITWHEVADPDAVKVFINQITPYPMYQLKGRGEWLPDLFLMQKAYCEKQGLEVPTKDDFLDALGNSQTNKDANVNPNLMEIPGMKDRFFWSSTENGADGAWIFINGEIKKVKRGSYWDLSHPNYFHFRCINRNKG